MGRQAIGFRLIMSLKSREWVKKANHALVRRDWSTAVKAAQTAIGADQADFEAHKCLALAHDRKGELVEAFGAYETALKLKPDGTDLLQPLAQLAFRLNLMTLSATFYEMLLSRQPSDLALIDAYATTLRELGRFDEAIACLQGALNDEISQTADAAPLWNTIGTILVARGELETALIFFNQSLTLKTSAPTRFHLGCALMELDRFGEALPELEACLGLFHDPDNRASVSITHAQALLASGDLTNGWKAYEARREKTGSFNELAYDLKVPRLKPEAIDGKPVLLVAEQGLGDEVLFATLLPDIIRRFAPGHVTLSVEPRLKTLMQRSWPEITVISHTTSTQNGRLTRRFETLTESLEGFSLLGDFLKPLRSSLSDFPEALRPLTPDPARVVHWKAWLGGLGTGAKLGLTWKSLKPDVNRDRYYASFEAWLPLLRLEDAIVISLQYGNTDPEFARVRDLGLRLIRPPGIDLMDDLDDLAALMSALDAVIGPSNATTNIAAACNLPVYMTSSFKSWIFLGADHHPFYPSVRLFISQPSGQADPATIPLIEQVKTDLVCHI